MNAKASGSVLLVDDNATNLDVLYQTLEPTGHRILVARRGEDALRLAKTAQPDLILLDIMMPPGIDGFETLRRLKGSPDTSRSAVIMLSSLDDVDSKVRGFCEGAVDYIAKPFQSEEVVARVATHLRLFELQRQLEKEKRELAEANQRMETDLASAARVQKALLPSEMPEQHGYRFGWQCQPCQTLGGDALDIFRIDDHRIGFYALDVSGHGVPSSLLAVSVGRSLAPRTDGSSLVIEPRSRSRGLRPVAPRRVARRLNQIFQLNAKNPHFFTIVYGVLDARTGEVDYVCAGHPPPLVVRADGRVEPLEGGAPPIGITPDMDFTSQKFELRRGDRLYVYSDGLFEQRDTRGVACGRQWLARHAADAPPCAAEAASLILAAVRSWAGEAPITDDLSLLSLHRDDGAEDPKPS